MQIDSVDNCFCTSTVTVTVRYLQYCRSLLYMYEMYSYPGAASPRPRRPLYHASLSVYYYCNGLPSYSCICIFFRNARPPASTVHPRAHPCTPWHGAGPRAQAAGRTHARTRGPPPRDPPHPCHPHQSIAGRRQARPEHERTDCSKNSGSSPSTVFCSRREKRMTNDDDR